ncbi:MAG: DUF3488 and transglutaminase-like domain-containing protein [Actinomycetota bacterium]
MAHTPGTPARIQRLSALVAIVAVAFAIALAFGRILQGSGATSRLLAVGLASGAIAWATERRGMLLATVCSAAGLLLALTWLAAPHTTWFGLPTIETLRTLGSLATQVGGQAREYVSPAPATPALILAGTIAVWAAVFSCFALAFRAQSPLLALVPPLALIVFADSVLEEIVRPVFGVWFLIAALAVLFADSLRRIRGWGPVWSPTATRDRLFPAAGRNARRVGLTAVTVAALAPLLVPGFGTKPVWDLSSINSDGRIRVSPLVSMGAILNQSRDSNQEVVRVQTDHPTYWRMESLSVFDGNTWEAAPDDGVALQSGQSIPNGLASGLPLTQTFTVSKDLGFSWLLGAADPTSITIDHQVTWHPASSSLQMDGWPDQGESYTVTSLRADPSADDLRTAGVAQEPGSMVQLPADIPPVIAATALDWTRGAKTDYDRVMAIATNLTNGQFAYSLDVDYKDDSTSLAYFLTTSKRGFCQQFASLMAVMLRSLPHPIASRVALGFTPGTPVGGASSSYAVTMRNYHSWVEVPFQGYGWLSFDPTPGFVDPAASGYQQLKGAGDVSCPPGGHGCGSNLKGGTGLTGPHGGLTPKDPTVAQQGNGDLSALTPPSAKRSVPLSIIATTLALLGLIAALSIPLLRRASRRSRLHAAHNPRTLILATYDVFGERAGELGWARSPGETPEEFRRRLASSGAFADENDAQLARMTTAVVLAAYAPGRPDDAAATDMASDSDGVLRELRDAAPLRQRVLGLYRRD